MRFEVTYGDESLAFEVDKRHLPVALPFIAPRRTAVTKEMGDVEGRIRQALEAPTGSERLKDLVPDKRVALIISDEFRSGHQELIIKHIMAEIAAGSPKEVWTFCATGSHDPKIYAVHIKKWAEKFAALNKLKHRFIANDCTRDNFIPLGFCSDGIPVEVNGEILKCEVRAYGHEGKHHYMNGYSCIDKQLLPGLSSAKSITLNHKHALNDEHSFGGRNVWVADPKRQINPFSAGCSEARKIADATLLDDNEEPSETKPIIFGLDMISDKTRVYWAASGDTEIISREMIVNADKFAAFEVEPTKYVVISPGGPPASGTIYSAQNCFDMALSGAIEDGGEALIIAPCEGRPDVPEETRGLAPDEKSKKLFYDNLARMKSLSLEKSLEWIDKNFELYLWKTDRVLKLMNKRGVKLYLYSTLPDEKVKAIGFVPVKSVQAWIDERAKRNDSLIRVIDEGNKVLVMSK